MHIDFWNVGQGDASSICWKEAENGVEHIDLIDVGPPGTTQVSEYFVPNARVKSWVIDNLILTHNDNDHIGGLSWLRRKVEQEIFCIQNVYLVDDWERQPARKNSLAWLISRYSRENRLHRLEGPQIICNIGEYVLETIYPDFAANIRHAGTPNCTSGILRLRHQNTSLVVWGGDNKLATLVGHVSQPIWLFGPHHGAPQDKKTKKHSVEDRLSSFVASIAPAQCVLFFCTENGYGHPKQEYLQALCQNDCQVTCIQQARQCKAENGNS